MFGSAPSKGTLAQAIEACAAGLEPVEKKIQEGLAQAAIVHCDETGSRVEGKLGWLHSASTSTLTHSAVHGKRGSEAMKEIGVMETLTGRIIHDGWASYFRFDLAHGLCNAHHLRELTFLEEQCHLDWAGQMKALLRKAYVEVLEAKGRGEPSLGAQRLREIEARYTALLEEGLAEDRRLNPPAAETAPRRRGRRKQSPGKNLLDRLSRHREATLAFVHDFTVPFDNNQAERDLRMTQVQMKISGGFRSEAGAKAFFRIRGYISTLLKQDVPVLNRVVAQ